jgi:hypothetical protein
MGAKTGLLVCFRPDVPARAVETLAPTVLPHPVTD